MKAILVIDLPSDLDISLDEFKADITMLSKDFSKSMLFHKYKNIEIKPMPQKDKYDVKKYATVDYEDEETLGHYLNIGWNACIDEILGGNDEEIDIKKEANFF